MESIKIDNDVFIHLQKHARPFVDTPNSTLRRLLGIDEIARTSAQRKLPVASNVLDDLLAESFAATNSRAKAPKANLEILVKKRFLKNGQKVYLIDYQSNRVQNIFALISDSGLSYNNQQYSMSKLAQELLTNVGFKSNSVRGPAHWETEDGKLIQDLWQQHLGQNS